MNMSPCLQEQYGGLRPDAQREMREREEQMQDGTRFLHGSEGRFRLSCMGDLWLLPLMTEKLRMRSSQAGKNWLQTQESDATKQSMQALLQI